MIKKYYLLIYFIICTFVGLAQPSIKKLDFPKAADVYGLYELSFQLGTYANPYDPEVIDVYAVFQGPDGATYRVNGFYYEGYRFTNNNGVEEAARQSSGDGWRVRFTPNVPGRWTFVLYAADKKGQKRLEAYQGSPLAFDCRPKNAEGFIRTANSHYLKRETFVDGRSRYRSFFPVGPNIAWYDAADYGFYKKPYGIYDYERYMKRFSGKINYLRIWINRYQCLSLYGPEHAGTADGKTRMYFDNTLNQKDAAELDHIVKEAQSHGISLMVNIFNFRDFIHKSSVTKSTDKRPAEPSDWINNPYHTVLGLSSKYDFFTDARAVRISKNLIRYIVARWGYATNILCWELWNEVANMADNDLTPEAQRDMVRWHNQMTAYIHAIDPYRHLISTSLGSAKDLSILMKTFDPMDFVQKHNYQNIQKAKSKEEFSHVLYRETEKARDEVPGKPFFMGEFGFGQSSTKVKYDMKDPKGVDLHNALWASAFSGAMGPASFWYWEVLSNNNWFDLFKPVTTFLDRLPLLSDTFIPKHTGTDKGSALVFPNGLATYYMVNASQDTLMGWSQDTAFRYQSLRRLTDRVGNNGHFVDDGMFDPEGYVYTLNPARRPAPSGANNRIVLPIEDQPRGTRYKVRWYDAETGMELTDEATTAIVRKPWFQTKRLVITFPSSVRDLWGDRVNNTFGDAVFMITKE